MQYQMQTYIRFSRQYRQHLAQVSHAAARLGVGRVYREAKLRWILTLEGRCGGHG
jgi:hypothetical protein